MDQNLKQNLDAQLSEMDMLQAMFCNPGELKIDDPSCMEEIRQFLAENGTNSRTIPQFIDFTINFEVDNSKFEVCVNLSHEYPQIEPDIFVRNAKLSKTEHTRLNKDLNECLNKWLGDPCVFSAISWLQENASSYLAPKEPRKTAKANKKSGKLVRYWIYSHHIYSKTKRKEILALATTLHVTGFCMAGKPGIICVEGYLEDCNEWWSQIKSMNWKKIFCKLTEDCSSRKFQNFEEITFPNQGLRASHMDMGEFYKYLETNNCAYIFKDLFGVDKNGIRENLGFE